MATITQILAQMEERFNNFGKKMDYSFDRLEESSKRLEEKFLGFTKDVKTFTPIILDEEYKKPFKIFVKEEKIEAPILVQEVDSDDKVETCDLDLSHRSLIVKEEIEDYDFQSLELGRNTKMVLGVCDSLGSVLQGGSEGLLHVGDMRQNAKATLESGGCSSFSLHVQVRLKSNMDEELGSSFSSTSEIGCISKKCEDVAYGGKEVSVLNDFGCRVIWLSIMFKKKKLQQYRKSMLISDRYMNCILQENVASRHMSHVWFKGELVTMLVGSVQCLFFFCWGYYLLDKRLPSVTDRKSIKRHIFCMWITAICHILSFAREFCCLYASFKKYSAAECGLYVERDLSSKLLMSRLISNGSTRSVFQWILVHVSLTRIRQLICVKKSYFGCLLEDCVL